MFPWKLLVTMTIAGVLIVSNLTPPLIIALGAFVVCACVRYDEMTSYFSSLSVGMTSCSRRHGESSPDHLTFLHSFTSCFFSHLLLLFCLPLSPHLSLPCSLMLSLSLSIAVFLQLFPVSFFSI